VFIQHPITLRVRPWHTLAPTKAAASARVVLMRDSTNFLAELKRNVSASLHLPSDLCLREVELAGQPLKRSEDVAVLRPESTITALIAQVIE